MQREREHPDRYSRREFALRMACSLPGARIGEASADEPKSRVAVVWARERKAGIDAALSLLTELPPPGARVILKASFNSAHPCPGSTHPETLAAVVKYLRGRGVEDLTLVERSGMGNTNQIWSRLQVPSLAKELGLTLVSLDELPPSAWRRERLDGSDWKRGVEVPRFLSGSASIVQVCNLKTHRFGGHFSASLKNCIGLIAKMSQDGAKYNYMSELHGSQQQRAMIAQVNQLYVPHFVVMDAMAVFVRRGPETGAVANPGIIAVSRDRVALDAFGVALLRLYGAGFPLDKGPIFDQGQIREAARLGLGVQSPEEIDFVTSDPAARRIVTRVSLILRREEEDEGG